MTQATQSVAQPLLRLTKSVFSWKRVFHSECTRTVFDALKMYGMPPPGGGPARMLKAGPRSGKRGHEPGSGLLSSVQHVPGDCMSSTCTQRPPLLSSSVVARSRGICRRTLCSHDIAVFPLQAAPAAATSRDGGSTAAAACWTSWRQRARRLRWRGAAAASTAKQPSSGRRRRRRCEAITNTTKPRSTSHAYRTLQPSTGVERRARAQLPCEQASGQGAYTSGAANRRHGRVEGAANS